LKVHEFRRAEQQQQQLNNIKIRVKHLQEELNNTTKKLNINKKSQITTKKTIEQQNYQNQATTMKLISTKMNKQQCKRSSGATQE
jgi:hypothetical protein